MKKKISLLVVSVLFITLLAGCGGNPKQNGSDQKNGKTEKRTIEVMMNGTASDTVTKSYQAIADEFSKNNEFDAVVNLQFYENEQYKTKLTTLMASNKVPDVFFTWELDYLRPFVEGGKVYEIGQDLDKDQEWKDTFLDGVLEPVTYDDKLYGIPCQKSFAVMFYNKQIFKENGLTVPKTYEEFLQVCQTLKNNGITPITLAATDAWIPAQFVLQTANGIGGLELYNGITNGTKKWNETSQIEAALDVQDMIKKGYFQDGMLGMTAEESQSKMKQGKAAMYFQGCWDTGTLLDKETSKIADHVGAFALPAKIETNNNILVGSVDTILAIAENSKNKDIAVAFIKYFSSPKSQEKLLYEQGRLPSAKINIDKSKLNPLIQEIIDISNQTVGLTPWWDRALGAGVGTEFNNKCQAIFGGNDPQAEFDDLQTYEEENRKR